jgi:hypothetical protein
MMVQTPEMTNPIQTTQAEDYNKLYNHTITQPLTFYDSLTSTNSSNWEKNGTCLPTNTGFQVSQESANFVTICHSLEQNYSNFLFQVDMDITQGGFGGFIFRAVYETKQKYLFQMNNQGEYFLYYYLNNKPNNSVRLTSGKVNFYQANSTNKLAVFASGDDLHFFLNGKFFTSIQDAHRLNGIIGLIASCSTACTGNELTRVTYRNAEAWRLT